MALVNTITRPINDFAVARLYGARSFTSWAEDAVARARSEEGGVGIQAAIITVAFLIAGGIVAAVIRTRATDAADAITLPVTAAYTTLAP